MCKVIPAATSRLEIANISFRSLNKTKQYIESLISSQLISSPCPWYGFSFYLLIVKITLFKQTLLNISAAATLKCPPGSRSLVHSVYHIYMCVCVCVELIQCAFQHALKTFHMSASEVKRLKNRNNLLESGYSEHIARSHIHCVSLCKISEHLPKGIFRGILQKS